MFCTYICTYVWIGHTYWNISKTQINIIGFIIENIYVAHNIHMNAQWLTFNKHMYTHIQYRKRYMLYKCKDICWVNENLCATYENGYVLFM